jgi:hypothetical protein
MLLISVSCNKDKFTTIPQVTIKSISPDFAMSGDVIKIRGSFTDQEGDVDSALFIYKWYNGAAVAIVDTVLRQPFEDFKLPPKTTQADILIDLELNTFNTGLPTLTGPSVRDTTAAIGLIFIDKAGNRSVYAESPPIRLKKS